MTAFGYKRTLLASVIYVRFPLQSRHPASNVRLAYKSGRSLPASNLSAYDPFQSFAGHLVRPMYPTFLLLLSLTSQQRNFPNTDSWRDVRRRDTLATSILIAKLIGPVMLVAAIAMLVDAKGLQEMAREFLKDRALIFVTGVLAMLGGLAIVNNHNIWIADWSVMITLFGWAMFIGGAVRIALPAVVRSIGGAMMEKPTMIRVTGTFWALIGTFLAYKGYFQAP